MSNGALSIPISADASKFLKTLATVKDEIKVLKKELDTATGTRVAEINLKITGLEQQKRAFTEFGKYAEGTYGALLQQLDYLNAYKLTLKVGSQELIDTVAKLKEVNTLIDTANGKQIKVKAEVEPPPTGSIKDIQNSIKKYQGLRDIAVDTSSLEKFNKILQRLEERLNRLKNTGIEIPPPQIDEEPLANSIAGIRKQIRSLEAEKAVIDISDQGSIAKLNTQIDQLEDKIKKADRVGFDSKGNISQNAGKARQALTSLTLVAQDLPFGFIAIQNNLPNLLQTFGELKTQSNGLKGAFKEFGKQLIGPGGFFLAFSAVTSAITYAVKEYGSMSNAIDALFGRLSPLHDITERASKSLKDYNKNLVTNGEAMAQATGSMQGQILKANTLAGIVLNLSESEENRKRALSQLKSLDKDRFEAFDIEKGKLEGLKGAVDDYTRSLLANAVAQKFIDRVASTAEQLENQRNLYAETLKKVDELEKSGIKTQIENLRKLNEQIVKQGGLPQKSNANIKFYEESTAKLKEQEATLRTLSDAYNKLAITTKGYIAAASNLGTIETPGGGNKGGAGKVTKGIIDEGELNNGVITSNLEYLQRVAMANVRITNASIDKMLRYRDSQAENAAIDAFVPKKIPKTIGAPMSDELTLMIGQNKQILDTMSNQFLAAKELLTETFFAPLTDLFTSFFEKGKFAFADFGKAILNTLKQLAAKIIATGIINLLANILIPGGGKAASLLGKATTGAGGGILGAFGAAFKSVLGLKQVSNPNFAGVQGGGMQLAGEVVFRQRGSDLVGVINRTNGTISRVG
jgi:hypothetical protein